MSAAITILPAETELDDDQLHALLAEVSKDLSQAESNSIQLRDGDEPRNYVFPKLQTGNLVKPYVSMKGTAAQVDGQRLLASKYDTKSIGIRKVDDPVASKKAALEKKKATAGSDWYNLPKTDLTPELKRDLQLLKMRNVLDPHRHYKKDNGKMAPPKFSQVGTIIEGPTEFYSGRMENKQRKKTFVEEVLAGEQETGRFKRKYGELQEKKTSGKKAFYKALKEKRKGGIKKG